MSNVFSAFDAAAALSKSYQVGAMKAATRAGGGGPYASESSTRGNPFGQASNMASAAKQYAALRDIPYTAIRPIAVKVADQPIRVGYADQKSENSPTPAGLRTKSLTYLSAPTFIRKQISEGMEPDLSHPLLETFENPNDYMTGWAQVYCTAMSICATGDGYWFMDDASGRLQFFYLPKTWVTPVHTKERAFAAYKVKPPGVADSDEIPVPHQNMLHFRFPDPADPLGSLSPLQTQARAVNTDDEIQKAQFALMKNGIFPSVAITVGEVEHPSAGKMTPELTPEQRRQIIDSARLHYAGTTHYGDPWIIDGKFKSIEKISNTSNDLDFMNGSGLTKSRIMQGIGTSPVVAGQSENANRAGSYVAHDVFYRLTVNPICTLMSQTFTAKLRMRAEQKSADLKAANERAGKLSIPGRKLYIWIEEARADDADLELAKMNGAQTAMAVTKNEWREFCGLPKSDDPEADKLPKPPEPPLAGKPPGMSTTKPKPAGKRKNLRARREKKRARDFFVKGLLSELS